MLDSSVIVPREPIDRSQILVVSQPIATHGYLFLRRLPWSRSNESRSRHRNLYRPSSVPLKFCRNRACIGGRQCSPQPRERSTMLAVAVANEERTLSSRKVMWPRRDRTRPDGANQDARACVCQCSVVRWAQTATGTSPCVCEDAGSCSGRCDRSASCSTEILSDGRTRASQM